MVCADDGGTKEGEFRVKPARQQMECHMASEPACCVLFAL